MTEPLLPCESEGEDDGLAARALSRPGLLLAGSVPVALPVSTWVSPMISNVPSSACNRSTSSSNAREAGEVEADDAPSIASFVWTSI